MQTTTITPHKSEVQLKGEPSCQVSCFFVSYKSGHCSHSCFNDICVYLARKDTRCWGQSPHCALHEFMSTLLQRVRLL